MGACGSVASTSYSLAGWRWQSLTAQDEEGGITTMTITLPDEVATQIKAEHISQEQLDTFVVAAVKAWLRHRQVSKDMQHIVQERPWSEAFQDSADDFMDRLIDENKVLFETMARL